MTADERIDFTYALLANNSETEIDSSVVETQLTLAKSAMLNRLYPLQDWDSDTDVPKRYHELQCKLAVRYIARIGAEGEVKHAENGIERAYSTVDDWDILSQIIPYAKVNV